ncbi:hypothetical protein Tco_0591401 [Tanacetum coccineum]
MCMFALTVSTAELKNIKEAMADSAWIEAITKFTSKDCSIWIEIKAPRACSQAVNKSPTHYPCDSARTFRVILFSIHNDEWKSFQCHHQTALRRPYALSWKPCQGDSLNLPDHRIHKDGDGDASFQLKSDSLPHAHAQTTKTFHKHQDSKNHESSRIKDKDFRTNSDIQDLPSKISSLSREIVSKLSR